MAVISLASFLVLCVFLSRRFFDDLDDIVFVADRLSVFLNIVVQICRRRRKTSRKISRGLWWA